MKGKKNCLLFLLPRWYITKKKNEKKKQNKNKSFTSWFIQLGNSGYFKRIKGSGLNLGTASCDRTPNSSTIKKYDLLFRDNMILINHTNRVN